MPDAKPLCLMIVDDQEPARIGLRDALALQPGVGVVLETDNGLDAAQLAEARCPDVVLTEVRLPKCGGIELIGFRTPSPGHTKSGRMKFAGSRRVSRTSRRIDSLVRSRRAR